MRKHVGKEREATSRRRGAKVEVEMMTHNCSEAWQCKLRQYKGKLKAREGSSVERSNQREGTLEAKRS